MWFVFTESALGEVHGDALTAADAHADHCVLLVGAHQFVHDLDGEDAAGCADRMTDGDAAAVDVGLLRVQTQIAADRKRLACRWT